MNHVLLFTLGIIFLIGLLFLLVMMPNKKNDYEFSQDSNLDPTLKKILALVGSDIHSFTADKVSVEAKNNDITRLIEASGNPWNVSAYELVALRYVFACLYFVGASLLTAILAFVHPLFGLVGVALVIGATLLGFQYPTTYYESVKKDRESKFKANLPEAIDYLVMILGGGGYSLPIAFEMSLDYLPEGVVRDEFTKIVTDLHTGQSMETALNNFAKRVPSESIKAFVKALNNANKLSVNILDILITRSKESRKELELEIEKRVSTLGTRVMLVLSPTSAIAVILVSASPSFAAIINMMAG